MIPDGIQVQAGDSRNCCRPDILCPVPLYEFDDG